MFRCSVAHRAAHQQSTLCRQGRHPEQSPQRHRAHRQGLASGWVPDHAREGCRLQGDRYCASPPHSTGATRGQGYNKLCLLFGSRRRKFRHKNKLPDTTDVTNAEDGNLWLNSFELTDVIDKLRNQSPEATHFVVFDAGRDELRLTRSGKSIFGAEKGFVPVGNTSGVMDRLCDGSGENGFGHRFGGRALCKGIGRGDRESRHRGGHDVPQRATQDKAGDRPGPMADISDSAGGFAFSGRLSLPIECAVAQCGCCRKSARYLPSSPWENRSPTCGWRSGTPEASGSKFCSET